MPSYKDNPPDEEYLDSIKKHTNKETNTVDLALVAKEFGYASAKSFQKKYAKLKKAYKLTNGHIYGDDKRKISSTEAAQNTPNETTETTEPKPEISSTEVAQNTPNETTETTKLTKPTENPMEILEESLELMKMKSPQKAKSMEKNKKKQA